MPRGLAREVLRRAVGPAAGREGIPHAAPRRIEFWSERREAGLLVSPKQVGVVDEIHALIIHTIEIICTHMYVDLVVLELELYLEARACLKKCVARTKRANCTPHFDWPCAVDRISGRVTLNTCCKASQWDTSSPHVRHVRHHRNR